MKSVAQDPSALTAWCCSICMDSRFGMVSSRGTATSYTDSYISISCPALPQPRVRTILHLGKVHMVTARLENLIMISLQKARERVNLVETV